MGFRPEVKDCASDQMFSVKYSGSVGSCLDHPILVGTELRTLQSGMPDMELPSFRIDPTDAPVRLGNAYVCTTDKKGKSGECVPTRLPAAADPDAAKAEHEHSGAGCRARVMIC